MLKMFDHFQKYFVEVINSKYTNIQGDPDCSKDVGNMKIKIKIKIIKKLRINLKLKLLF